MSRRILVADDSSTIQKVIKIAFARYSIDIVEAGSYVETLSAVGRSAPDALIIDASLPGARGPQDFAKLLAEAKGAPLLLLVGTYESVDEDAFRQAGFQHFLKKPFESSDIVAMVDRLLGGELGAAAPRPPMPMATPSVDLGGPTMPPLPGSDNRARHATVIHTGGVGTLAGGFDPTRPPPAPSGRPGQTMPPAPPRDDAGADDQSWATPGDGDDDDQLAGAMPPPPPVLDQARKGRRAFEPGDAPPSRETIHIRRDSSDATARAGGAESRQGVPPPPMSLSLDDEDDLPGLGDTSPSRRPGSAGSPLPPIPPGLGRQPRPAAGDDDDALRLSLDDDDDAYAAPPPAPGRTTMPPGQGPRPPRPQAPAAPRAAADAGGLEALETVLKEQLPALVRQAVEEYCERHFKSLAREIIATELRRLADEKARHLVDG